MRGERYLAVTIFDDGKSAFVVMRRGRWNDARMKMEGGFTADLYDGRTKALSELKY